MASVLRLEENHVIIQYLHNGFAPSDRNDEFHFIVNFVNSSSTLLYEGNVGFLLLRQDSLPN